MSRRSHSALLAIIAPVGPSSKSRKRSNTRLIDAMFAAIRASSSSCRPSSLPLGSPTLVVPPPISTIGRCPVCCRMPQHHDRDEVADVQARRRAVIADGIGGHHALWRPHRARRHRSPGEYSPGLRGSGERLSCRSWRGGSSQSGRTAPLPSPACGRGDSRTSAAGEGVHLTPDQEKHPHPGLACRASLRLSGKRERGKQQG